MYVDRTALISNLEWILETRLSKCFSLTQTRRVAGFAVHLASAIKVLCVFVCVLGEEGA